jgi:hypothetical protein
MSIPLTAFTSMLLPLAMGLSSIEGPIPADRHRSVDEPAPTGVWFNARFEGTDENGRYWVGPQVGGGVVHPWGEFFFRVPILLDPISGEFMLPPFRPAAPCVHESCSSIDPQGVGSGIDTVAHAIPFFVENFQLETPGGLFRAKGGPLRLRLGHGGLVDGYMNRLSHADSDSGLYLSLRDPIGIVQVQGAMGNMLRPTDFMAAGIQVHPFRLMPTAFIPRIGPLLGRAGMRFDAAIDSRTPTHHAQGLFFRSNTTKQQAEDPLVGGSHGLDWALFSPSSPFQVTPFVGVGMIYGLASTLNPPSKYLPANLGVGSFAGMDLQLQMPWVGLRIGSMIAYDGQGHRTGYFDPLYRLEREYRATKNVDTRSHLGSDFAHGGALYRMEVEWAVTSHLRFGGQWAKGESIDDDRLELHGIFSFLGAQVGAQYMEKSSSWVHALATQLQSDGFISRYPEGHGESESGHLRFFALHGSLAIWGPVSVYGKCIRLWENSKRESSMQPYYSWTVGISSSLVLNPGF